MAGSRLPPPPLCPADAVCLRGNITAHSDGTHVIEGDWAANKMTLTKGGLKNRFMNQSSGLPGQPIPRDGTYRGHFFITEGGKNLKQVDDVMELRFQMNAVGGYNIEGSADNIYGHFNVTGTITPSGRAELFKAIPALAGVGGAATAAGSGGGRQRGVVSSGGGGYSGGGGSRNSKGSRGSPPAAALVPAAALGGGDLGSAGPVTPKAAEAFRELLRMLKSRDNSSWFFVAVDPARDGAPGYFDVIQHPMDLGLVGEKLDRDEYNSRDEFYQDAKLVFKNATVYNTNPLSLIRKAAVNFNKTLGTHIRKIEEGLGNYSFKGVANSSGGGGSFNKSRPPPLSSPTLHRPASAIGGSSAGAQSVKAEAAAYSGMDGEPPPAEPLSIEEQRELARKIDVIFKWQRIAEEKCHAYVVWQFITRRVSAENRKREGDEIVLDVDLLTPEAGRELLSICNHFLNSRHARDNRGGASPGEASGTALGGSGKRPAAAMAGSAAEADNAAEAALAAALAANLYDGDEDDEDEEEEDEVVQRKRPKVDADNGGTSSDEEAQFDVSAPVARQIDRQENRIVDAKQAAAKAGEKTPQGAGAVAASTAVASAEAAVAGAVAAAAGAGAAAADAAVAAAAAAKEEEASAAEEASAVDEASAAEEASAADPDANASAAAWGEMEDEDEEGGGGAGDEDGDGGGGGGGGDDGWERARLEKLEKERRQREREEKEVALAEEQRLRQAAREREIAEEAERQRRQREEDEKREAEEAERRAKEEEIRRAKKKEEERKSRQAQGQDVDLDEVRGDAELMGLMDDAEGFD